MCEMCSSIHFNILSMIQFLMSQLSLMNKICPMEIDIQVSIPNAMLYI